MNKGNLLTIVGVVALLIASFGYGMIFACALPLTETMSYELFQTVLPLWALAIGLIAVVISIIIIVRKDETK